MLSSGIVNYMLFVKSIYKYDSYSITFLNKSYLFSKKYFKSGIEVN